MMITNQGLEAATQVIPWCDVTQVAIRTTSDGPFADDVFWMFCYVGGLAEIPGSHVTGEHLAILQQQLVGLDNLKMIDAMGSTAERIFQVWHVEHAASGWSDERHAARFASLVERLGGTPSPEIFATLRAAWSARERHYHNLEHLADCLRELDSTNAPRPLADIAELALWYHDAVYVAAARDSEERSAELLVEHAHALGLGVEVTRAAAACIEVTTHGGETPPSGSAAELVIDIDLAILGREPLRFMDFEYAIAEEYAAVPWTRFVLGRGAFLAAMLRRDTIFHTETMHERYEAAARRNITALLASARYRPHRLLGGVYRLLMRTRG